LGFKNKPCQFEVSRFMLCWLLLLKSRHVAPQPNNGRFKH